MLKSIAQLAIFVILLLAAMQVLQELGARDVGAGETPYSSLFYVIEQRGDVVVPAQLGEADKHGQYILHSGSGTLKEGFDTFAYEILEENSDGQKIRVRYKGDNYNSVSVYRAWRSGGFEPLRWKFSGPGHMFAAVAISLVLMGVAPFLARFAVGCWWMWKRRRNKAGSV